MPNREVENHTPLKAGPYRFFFYAGDRAKPAHICHYGDSILYSRQIQYSVTRTLIN